MSVGRAAAALHEIERIAWRHADEASAIEARSLINRSMGDELTVLIAGQFKRGKSTLINALIGNDILPTGALPLTSIATSVHFGREGATIVYRNGGSSQIDIRDLSEYVTETGNPENVRAVHAVDVRVHAEFLHGLRIVDTPGIGSAFVHNTETARSALREAEVAILVVGPEPPIGEAEIAFTKDVRDASERLFVVYNKADLLPEQEHEIIAFTQRQLDAALGFSPRMFALSARNALSAAQDGRVDSRFAEFVSALTRFLDRNRDLVRERSIARKSAALARRLQFLISLRRHALLLPLNERETLRTRFDTLVTDLGDRNKELGIALDQMRSELGENLDRLLGACFQRSCVALTTELRTAAQHGDIDAFEHALERGAATSAAAWVSDVTTLVNQKMKANAERLCRQVDRLESEILSLGASLVKADVPPPTSLASTFDVPGISFPRERIADTGLEILVRQVSLLLPRILRSRLLIRHLAQRVEERLDARRGRLRYAAGQEINRNILELGDLATTRLAAAEDAIRRGLSGPADVNEDDVRVLLRSCEHDEATAIALADDLDAIPSEVERVTSG
ncbi:MAG: dynamin family protein [Vulcanimicrobiaceae bacterium]